MLPGPAVPGCSLVSFHFLWEILCPQAVTVLNFTVFLINHIACMSLVRGFCNFVWFSILHLRKQQTKLMNDRLPHTRWLIWSTSLYERDRVIPRSPSPNWLRFLSLSLSLSLSWFCLPALLRLSASPAIELCWSIPPPFLIIFEYLIAVERRNKRREHTPRRGQKLALLSLTSSTL